MTHEPDPDGSPHADSESGPEVVGPDAVISGDAGDRAGEHETAADGSFGLDDLAERAVEVVFGLLRRAGLLARGVLIFAAIAGGLGFGLGIAALSGGARAAWVLIGGFFLVISVGAVLVAIWRLRLVRRGGDVLVDEVRTLIGGDRQSERTVVETVESTEGSVDDDGIVVLSRRFFSLKDAVQGHTSNFASLSLALSSITSFPGLMALATVIAFGMLGLAAIFGLILIF